MAFFGGGMCRVVSRPQAAQKEKACHAASLFDRDTDRWHTQKGKEPGALYIKKYQKHTHNRMNVVCTLYTLTLYVRK
jgi:hypothetical protein